MGEPEQKTGSNKKVFVKRTKTYAIASTLGLNLAGGMAIFSMTGWWLDQKRGGGIIFTMVGVLLGLVYGGYEMWKTIRQLNESEQTTETHSKESS